MSPFALAAGLPSLQESPSRGLRPSRAAKVGVSPRRRADAPRDACPRESQIRRPGRAKGGREEGGGRGTAPVGGVSSFQQRADEGREFEWFGLKMRVVAVEGHLDGTLK